MLVFIDHLRAVPSKDIFKLVLLLRLLNFVCESKFKLMYIFHILNIRSYLIHLHELQVLVVLPYLTYRTHLVFTNRLNLLHLKGTLDSLVIVAKELLKLPNLLMLANIRRQSITSQNFDSHNFLQLSNSVRNEVSLIYLFYNGPALFLPISLY